MMDPTDIEWSMEIHMNQVEWFPLSSTIKTLFEAGPLELSLRADSASDLSTVSASCDFEVIDHPWLTQPVHVFS